MGDYEEQLAALQAESWAQLQRDLAKAKTTDEPLRHEQKYFLMLLISARHAKNLTQAGLAARLEMHRSAIARIESGRGNPSLRTLLVIADVLDVRLVLE